MMEIMDDDEYEYVERLNRSQQKRDLAELADAAKALAEQDSATLANIDLPDEIRTALLAAQGMKNQARKRQFKFIVKLMRKHNPDSWIEITSNLKQQDAEKSHQFHRVERWRDRLRQDTTNSVLTAFMQDYPQADGGQIRQLVRNANKEQAQQKAPKSARILFRLLRDTVGD
ncbi:MAG: ribosome biogenesis factor YjgA [Mariprofundaceae bacterium]|nr:ribosome biogenesis factor YjgA [Mariprofundaceae bacterium]